MVVVFLWQTVQVAWAKVRGAVANQKLIAKAVARIMPTEVEIELNRFISFFHIDLGLNYAFYEIRSRRSSTIFERSCKAKNVTNLKGRKKGHTCRGQVGQALSAHK